MTRKIEFDFEENLAILDGKKVTIDYLYKQLLNELNSQDCNGFYYDKEEIIFTKIDGVDHVFSYEFKNKDRLKLNDLLQKLDEINTRNIIVKLNKLKNDIMNKKYLDGVLYFTKLYAHEHVLVYRKHGSLHGEHFLKLRDNELAKPGIKDLIDEVISLHNNNEEFVFEYDFEMNYIGKCKFPDFIVNTKDDKEIESKIFDIDFSKPDILKNYLNKHRFKVLVILLINNFGNDFWNLICNDKAKIKWGILSLISLIEVIGFKSITISLEILLGVLAYYGLKKVGVLIRSNKNINKMVECLDEKYNLVDNESKEPVKEIEKQSKLAQLPRKTQKLADPFLRSLYLNIVTMKNYPEIDWSYEAGTIEDLAKKYVDVKKSKDLSSYELLNKYPNFLEIANSLDSLIEEKTKEQFNVRDDLDIISTELDGFKSVTLDTYNHQKLSLKH